MSVPELQQFDAYMAHLSAGLGHSKQRVGLREYSTGLLSTLSRKSVEPMAELLAPARVQAKHQSLHHFVANADWSDAQMLLSTAQWVVPHMDFSDGGWWIIDDTGFPKKGRASVGVARQYCGQLGKQDNCQVAVSVSLACADASVPVAWQLYLPESWADDQVRRARAGIPEDVGFATKGQIALAQIEALMDQGAPRHCVLADAGYGVDAALRDRLTQLQLLYAVGITSVVTVWAPGHAPLPPAPYTGRGKRASRLRLGNAPEHQPQSVKEVALQLDASQWQNITWREGSNHPLRSRFARVRVHAAHTGHPKSQLRACEWLLIEWPQGHKEPIKYWLSTLPEDMDLQRMVYEVKMRWRIERDYQDLKQELGLGHYEGRGWRGFHHHASLSIAAYGFLLGQRLGQRTQTQASKKASTPSPAIPRYYKPRGSPAHASPRCIVDDQLALAHRSSIDDEADAMPLLRET